MLSIGRLKINEDELVITFDRSSGPGGQNVNKLSTRACLSFDLASPSLTDEQREKLRHALRSRINKLGILRITCSTHRTQVANRAEVLETFASLLATALKPQKRRRPTKPTAGSRERRLTAKLRIKEKKADRRTGHSAGDFHAD